MTEIEKLQKRKEMYLNIFKSAESLMTSIIDANINAEKEKSIPDYSKGCNSKQNGFGIVSDGKCTCEYEENKFFKTKVRECNYCKKNIESIEYNFLKSSLTINKTKYFKVDFNQFILIQRLLDKGELKTIDQFTNWFQ